MPLLTGIADRLVAMDQGRIIASGAPAEVLHDPAVVASYLGTDPERLHSFRSNGPRRDRPSPSVTAKVGESMSHPAEESSRPSRLRRYGPVVAIVVVVAVIAAVVVLNRGGSSTTTGAPAPLSTSSADAAASFKQAVSFTEAKPAGTVGSIDWGSRCNVKTGKLAYPSFFAGECYAPFHGNNGGVTATGVTATAIKVVFYVPQDEDPVLSYILSAIKDPATGAQTTATMRDWVAFYNHFFETYGRTVQLVPFTATGLASDPIAARADAVTIATNIKPFAVWGGPVLTTAFADELAARKVLCIDCGSGDTNNYFQQRSPYVWSLGILPEQGMVHVTEWLRKQVAGRKASFAGESDLTGRTRKFGVVALVNNADSRAVLAEFKRLAAAAGIDVARYVTYASPTDLPTQAPALIARLKASGVTSVIFSGDPVAPQALTRAATGQHWFPEWIITGSTLTDTAAFGRSFDQRQWAHAFGVSFGAARTGITGAIPLYKWWTGQGPPDISGAALSVIDAALFFPRDPGDRAGSDRGELPHRAVRGRPHALRADPTLPVVGQQRNLARDRLRRNRRRHRGVVERRRHGAGRARTAGQGSLRVRRWRAPLSAWQVAEHTDEGVRPARCGRHLHDTSARGSHTAVPLAGRAPLTRRRPRAVPESR